MDGDANLLSNSQREVIEKASDKSRLVKENSNAYGGFGDYVGGDNNSRRMSGVGGEEGGRVSRWTWSGRAPTTYSLFTTVAILARSKPALTTTSCRHGWRDWGPRGHNRGKSRSMCFATCWQREASRNGGDDWPCF